MIADALIERLAAAAGESAVSRDPGRCEYLAEDIFARELPAGAVVRPGSRQALAEAVRETVAAGHAVIVRGGGMSYSLGYVPAEPDSVLFDMRGLNRILEINRDDMYVTVEAGTTWRDLHRALENVGLRTPYWGTLSGIHATVGGGLSQNSIFWGSGRYGSAAESVLGMDVVLADGSLLRTGSAGQVHAAPFFRHHGPDLTGLFCGDCGALGVKAAATLRLLPRYRDRAFGAFAFDDHRATLAAMAEVSRRDLAMECFGFDPYLQRQRMRRESLAGDAKRLMGVMKSAEGVGRALAGGARLALAGRRFMEDVEWSFATMVEERSPEAAERGMQAVRDIAAEHGGRELPDSVPRVLRANPFGPLNNIIGPEGERWAPVHGIVPHSRALAAMESVMALLDDEAERLMEHRIGVGHLLATVHTNSTVLEPVFFWPDSLEEIHRRTVEPQHLRRVGGFPENLDARTAVQEIRAALIRLFADLGAAHLQLGKSYLYREGLRPANWKLIAALKRQLDPTGRLNPGALGL